MCLKDENRFTTEITEHTEIPMWGRSGKIPIFVPRFAVSVCSVLSVLKKVTKL